MFGDGAPPTTLFIIVAVVAMTSGSEPFPPYCTPSSFSFFRSERFSAWSCCIAPRIAIISRAAPVPEADNRRGSSIGAAGLPPLPPPPIAADELEPDGGSPAPLPP